jgi:hypothetical protein
MLRIELEGAFEASPRHVVLAKHERCKSRPEAEARIPGTDNRGLGKRFEGVAESPGFDRLCARTRERGGILCGRRMGGGREGRKYQKSEPGCAPGCQGDPA